MIITNACLILVHTDSCSPVADPENFGGGDDKNFKHKTSKIEKSVMVNTAAAPVD